jgi:YqaJ-like recombinase protein
MLNKTYISKIKPMSDEWLVARRGKLTSSENHNLVSDKFMTTGCRSYLFRKVGELLTNVTATGELNTEATAHGLMYETEAVQKLVKVYGFKYVICQQLIAIPGTKFGSTPDGIIVMNESLDEQMYNVRTVEVKCPMTYANYIALAMCKTPQDLKAENKEYYWQVLDQMDNCDAMYGYFVAYHPDFKAGNFHVIEFRKMQPDGKEQGKIIQFPIAKDLAFLKERKLMASGYMDELYIELSSRQAV